MANETGYDKILLGRANEQELRDRVGEIIDYELVIAKDTDKVFYKGEDGALHSIAPNQDLNTKLDKGNYTGTAQDLNKDKQNITDDSLKTVSKNIVTAINEIIPNIDGLKGVIRTMDEETVLFEGEAKGNSFINLNDNWDNYKYVVVVGYIYGSYNVKHTPFLVSSIHANDTTLENKAGECVFYQSVSEVTTGYFRDTNRKQIFIRAYGDIRISKVIGLSSSNIFKNSMSLALFDNNKFIDLPSDFSPTLPCDFWRDSNNLIQHNMDFTQYKGGTKIYVDGVNGNDTSGDGSTTTPFATITKASNVAELGTESDYDIIVRNTSVFFIDESNINITLTDKNLSLYSENGSDINIINGQRNLVWTLDQNNTYYTTRTNTVKIVDFLNVDKNGNLKPYLSVETLAECRSTTSSWYTDGTLVYVHRSDEVIPTEDNIAVCLLATTIDIDLMGDSTFYAENCNFLTGLPFKINGDPSLTNRNGKFVCNNCYFSCGNDVFGNESNGDSLLVDSIKDTYMFECASSYARRDCFNYHFTTVDDARECLVLEYNCKSIEAGRGSAETNNNNTASHENVSILRIGCKGENAPIPIIDSGGCYSICIDCDYTNATFSNGTYYFGSSTTIDGKAYLINCSTDNNDIGLNTQVESYIYNFTGDIKDTGYQNILE